MEKQEKEFYIELDESHLSKREKTLSPWSLTLFFLVIILIVEIAIFYLGRNLRVSLDEDSTRAIKPTGGQTLINNSSEKGEFTVYLPEGLLCSQIAEEVKGDVSCIITPEALQISGKISPLLPANANAYFVPKIEDDQAKLELKEVKIGKIGTFQFLGSPLNPVLNKALKSSLGGDNIRVKSIDLETGLMVIIAER